MGNKLGRKFEKGHKSYLRKDSIIKISDSVKKRWKNYKYKKKVSRSISLASRGKVFTEEHKKRLSEVHIRRWDKIGRKPRGQNERVRDSKYIWWRRAVFSRDNYICQTCGVRGGKLEADHIKEWKNYPELRFEVSNGRTLCKKCHSLTPNYKGRAKVGVALS